MEPVGTTPKAIYRKRGGQTIDAFTTVAECDSGQIRVSGGLLEVSSRIGTGRTLVTWYNDGVYDFVANGNYPSPAVGDRVFVDLATGQVTATGASGLFPAGVVCEIDDTPAGYVRVDINRPAFAAAT